MMTRREQIFAALRQQPVDRVPFATYNLHPYGDSPHARDPSYRELLALVTDKAGLVCKAVMPVRQGGDAGLAAREESRQEETATGLVRTTIRRTPRGDLRQVVAMPRGQPALVTEHFIKTDADIDRYLSIPYDPPEFEYGSLAGLESEIGERGVIYLLYRDPMYAAGQLFHFEDFSVRCITDPAGVRRLIDHFFEQIREETRRMVAACRGHAVVFCTGGPEIATPPLMPPAVFHDLVLPYQRALIEIIHAGGQTCTIHCHGHVHEVLPDLLATGADGIEPIEPPPQGNITLAELWQQAAGRLCLMGHIQDQEFHSAPPGTMTRRVEEIARVVDGRTGYIMTPTCTPFQFPASPVFLRNYTEWVEAAARVFGTGR